MAPKLHGSLETELQGPFETELFFLKLSYIAPWKLSYKAPKLHASLKLRYKGFLKLSYYMTPELHDSLATWSSELSGSL